MTKINRGGGKLTFLNVPFEKILLYKLFSQPHYPRLFATANREWQHMCRHAWVNSDYICNTYINDIDEGLWNNVC